MRQNSAPHLAAAPTLLARIGKACAQAEADSLADWTARVQSVRAAAALAPPPSTPIPGAAAREERPPLSHPSPAPDHDVPNTRFRAQTRAQATPRREVHITRSHAQTRAQASLSCPPAPHVSTLPLHLSSAYATPISPAPAQLPFPRGPRHQLPSRIRRTDRGWSRAA